MPNTKPPRKHSAAPACQLALAVVLVFGGGSGIAQAARRVVIMPFSGPRGAAASAKVRRALRGYRHMPAGAFARAARAGGHTAAARRYKITAVVKGSIARRRGRWVLRVRVISGTGAKAGAGNFRLRGTRVDQRTARRVASSLRRWINRCQAPSGTPRRPPRQPPAQPPPAQPPPAQPPPAQPPPAVQPLPVQPLPSGKSGFDDGSDIDGGGAGTAASDLPRAPKPQGEGR
ncbi:MAG: hypothetical protein JRH20_12940, partial [Deltaproteobacteria bacterium]|nr:hypothetical protein [Deltaproteobacteria bacterium]